MRTDVRRVRVSLAERTYEILIGSGLLESAGTLIREVVPARKAVVISDENVARLYADRLLSSLKSAGYEVTLVTFPPGDASKSLRQAEVIYDRLAEIGLERREPIVALGGGVTGDLAGFVAATWLRGVPFIQVPTTLEADVDASVGGKVAVNHASGKNMIGAFWQPRRVIIDVQCLNTLDDRDLRAGLAESVKHGIIRDAEFFTWHERHTDQLLACDERALTYLVEQNCRIKASVVEADERESGLRAILNFGHTLGHALEAALQYAWRHGECVAVGMVAACIIAQRRGTFSEADVARITGLLEQLSLPTRIPDQVAADLLLEMMRRDKKVQAGRIRFVLPVRIGRVEIRDDVTEAEIAEVARRLGAQ